MISIKKYLGIIWMILSPLLIAFMLWQAYEKISAASGEHQTNTALQWGIILLVFIPICIGLYIFGKYAWQNEFAELPDNSTE